MSFSPKQPRCDGDSVRITVNITHSDGSPAVGESAFVSTIVAPESVGVTDRHGNFRVSFTPTAGTHDVARFVYGGAHFHQFGFIPCPFSDDRSFVVNGSVWHDHNGNGMQDAHDQLLRNQPIGIYGGCYGPGCFVPLRWARTNAAGQFEWTGLNQGGPFSPGDIAIPDWHVCVPESSRQIAGISLNGAAVVGWRIAHVETIFGIPIRRSVCVYLGQLSPGTNTFSMGVQYAPSNALVEDVEGD